MHLCERQFKICLNTERWIAFLLFLWRTKRRAPNWWCSFLKSYWYYEHDYMRTRSVLKSICYCGYALCDVCVRVRIGEDTLFTVSQLDLAFSPHLNFVLELLLNFTIRIYNKICIAIPIRTCLFELICQCDKTCVVGFILQSTFVCAIVLITILKCTHSLLVFFSMFWSWFWI